MQNVLQKRITRITPTTIIVGIDAAKDLHWARITDYRGIDLMKPVKVHNNMDGFESLLAKVEKQRQKHGCDQVMFGMEPSGHYWRALGWYLYLHESKPVLLGVNPYHTKQAKELDDNSQTKSDPKDAQVIAHLIREGRYFDTYLEAELEAVMNTLQLGMVLQSMLGVGSIISAAFLGEVGDISRFSNWKQVRSLAGLNLVENSSGKHKGKTKVSKRGRPYLRHMLYLAGECGCRCNPEMRAFYRYLRDRKSNPLNGHQAFVATGLKSCASSSTLPRAAKAIIPARRWARFDCNKSPAFLRYFSCDSASAGTQGYTIQPVADRRTKGSAGQAQLLH